MIVTEFFYIPVGFETEFTSDPPPSGLVKSALNNLDFTKTCDVGILGYFYW